jgi:AraC family transcriptional regulator
MTAATLKPGPDGVMRFAIRASSAGRSWNAFEASVYDVSAGVSARPPSTAHTLVLHLSAPVEGTCRCGGTLLHRVIKPGDIDFVPFGHAATWYDSAPGRVANLRLSPAIVEDASAAMLGTSKPTISFPAKLSLNDPVLRHLMLAIVADLDESNCGSPLFAESVATAIATHLITRYGTRRRQSHTLGRLSRRQLSRIVEFIEANLSSDLTLASIASTAGISQSHLKSSFKKAVGLPVHQFVLRRRIDYALQLLASKDASICDIAQRSGFYDQSHMTRSIRRTLGVTPTELARALRP